MRVNADAVLLAEGDDFVVVIEGVVFDLVDRGSDLDVWVLHDLH